MDGDMEALSAYAGKPGHASMMEANVMLALALCIVVLSLGFEFAKDRLQRATIVVASHTNRHDGSFRCRRRNF